MTFSESGITCRVGCRSGHVSRGRGNAKVTSWLLFWYKRPTWEACHPSPQRDWLGDIPVWILTRRSGPLPYLVHIPLPTIDSYTYMPRKLSFSVRIMEMDVSTDRREIKWSLTSSLADFLSFLAISLRLYQVTRLVETIHNVAHGPVLSPWRFVQTVKLVKTAKQSLTSNAHLIRSSSSNLGGSARLSGSRSR